MYWGLSHYAIATATALFLPSVADPGFPRRGSDNPQGWGNLLFGQNFPENCTENEKNWTQREHASMSPFLDPPMPMNAHYDIPAIQSEMKL